MTALDEAAAIGDVLGHIPDEAHSHRVNVVVVDDGSTDDTAAIARSHGASVLRNTNNIGKGASLRRALAEVRSEEFNAVVLMDADGQHDPSCLEALAEPVLNNAADVVIGSRYQGRPGRRGTPINRYIVRAATIALLKRRFQIHCTDPFSGFRVLSPAAVQGTRLCGDRYESELEMLLCASRTDLVVTERRIPKMYGPQTSKMSVHGGRFFGRLRVISGYGRTLAQRPQGDSSHLSTPGVRVRTS